jgi:hypothetical protein
LDQRYLKQPVAIRQPSHGLAYLVLRPEFTKAFDFSERNKGKSDVFLHDGSQQ